MENQNFLREIGRIVAGGYYDYQQVRLAAMNRLRGVVRTKNEGIDLSAPEEKKKEKNFDKKYADNNIFVLLGEMKMDGRIDDEEYEYVSKLQDLFITAAKMEKGWKDVMNEYIKTEDIWKMWLSGVKGISTVLCANMLREFGYCETYRHISSLWKHCGLHVVDGKAPRRKRGEKIDFSPRLRTLAWKIGDSFVKQRTPYYRDVYDKEKERQVRLMENGADNAPESLMHAELRARRKMVKIFLAHYWFVTRSIKGLEVEQPYVAKLGHRIIMPRFDEERGIYRIDFNSLR